MAIIAGNGDIDSAISRCTTRYLLNVRPGDISHLSIVKGVGQVGIARGNITGNRNVGVIIAHDDIIERVGYTIVIRAEPVGGNTVALGTAMIANGHGISLSRDVGRLHEGMDLRLQLRGNDVSLVLQAGSELDWRHIPNCRIRQSSR